MAPNGECDKCSAPNPKYRCSRCASAFYCNRVCQKNDWRNHNSKCVRLRGTMASSISEESPASNVDNMAGGRPLVVTPVPRTWKKKNPLHSHFPEPLRDFSYQASPDGIHENLLLLFHGLGDTHKPFFRLGQTLCLPQTCVLALSGPQTVPLTDGGRTWIDSFEADGDLIVPMATERRRLDSLASTLDNLQVFIRVLLEVYSWPIDRIHLLGFSQGAIIALHLISSLCQAGAHLGSVVAISGSLLEEHFLHGEKNQPSNCDKAGTPVIITHGSHDEVVRQSLVARTFECLKSAHPKAEVSIGEFNKSHAMVDSPEEMEALMKFWSSHLSHRMINLESGANLYTFE